MGKHRASFEQKAEWLVRHPHLVTGWPFSVTDDQIADAMRKDGLVSYGSNNWDIGDLGKLMGEAKSRLRQLRRGK